MDIKFKRDGRGDYYNDKYKISKVSLNPAVWVLEVKNDEGEWQYKTESSTKRECVDEIKEGWA